jgi:hypothetical protein
VTADSVGAGVVLSQANDILEKRLDMASPEQQTPEGLAGFHKAEIEKWWPIIKAANIKAE